jgi:hypothetical protein
MSIYPVRLLEWYPPGDESFPSCLTIVTVSRCYACNKRLRYRSAVGHHSIPWGQGDIWCSWKCCFSDKKSKPDHRRERRLKKRLPTEEKLIDLWVKRR